MDFDCFNKRLDARLKSPADRRRSVKCPAGGQDSGIEIQLTFHSAPNCITNAIDSDVLISFQASLTGLAELLSAELVPWQL